MTTVIIIRGIQRRINNVVSALNIKRRANYFKDRIWGCLRILVEVDEGVAYPEADQAVLTSVATNVWSQTWSLYLHL